MVVVLFLSTLLSFGFEKFNLRRENILIIYVVSVMLIMVETRKFIYAIFSTFLLVFVFNFFFTEPQYTFIIDDANYIITLIIFSSTILILGALTTTLQKEITHSKNSAKIIDLLYQISKDLIQTSNNDEILSVVFKHISNNLNKPILFYFPSENIRFGDSKIQIDEYQKETLYTMDYHIVTGKNEKKFGDLSFKLFPITGKTEIRGVLLVEMDEGVITRQELEFIQTTLLHMLTALERESISIEQEKTRLEMEKEKLKSILLRSISHDLRTPLTSIQTGSSLIFDSYDNLNDETKKSLILDINNESRRLSEFVDNVMNLTRLNADQMKLRYKKELIKDVFDDLHQRIEYRLDEHKIQFGQLKQDDFIYADIQLLFQVFINLIDNAIRHTRADSNISVYYEIKDSLINFYVEDDGGGIPKDQIDNIFRDYFSLDLSQKDKQRGIGLGLSICRSIIEAHKGSINVFNNSIGGTTFCFSIPYLEGDKNE